MIIETDKTKATAAKKAAPVSKTMTRPVVEVAQSRKAAGVPHISFADTPMAGSSHTRSTEEPVEAMVVEEGNASDEARENVSNQSLGSSEMLMFLYFAVEGLGGAAECCQGKNREGRTPEGGEAEG